MSDRNMVNITITMTREERKAFARNFVAKIKK